MAGRNVKEQKRQENKIYGVYISSMLTMKVALSISEVGQNIKQNLERMISKRTEGKCIVEGFVKPNSIRILTYSSGIVNNETIEFQTVFECMICHPVEGMLIECKTKTITKAGIHAEVSDESGIIPITAFIARDHHFADHHFAAIKENDEITIRVVGVRFELNDPYICVIGSLVQPTDIIRGKQYPTRGDKQRQPMIRMLGGDVDIEADENDDF
jgi:DNA-directed RNA polymerase subunit E'/Rpb7